MHLPALSSNEVDFLRQRLQKLKPPCEECIKAEEDRQVLPLQ